MEIPDHYFTHNGSRYNFTKGMYFEHVQTLKTGDAFGEQSNAMLSTRRKATIKVVSGWLRCATLSNQFYKRIVDKVDQKRLDDLLDFLMPIQCFHAHSRNAIIKFSYYMQKAKFVRNQVVFKQGQKASKVYIVWKGEFVSN